MGAKAARRLVISVALPRMMRVWMRPTWETWSTWRSPGSWGNSFSWNTTCILTTFSCRALRLRSMSTFPLERMPTWSHTSSSSRRLWEDTSTVVPWSATSPISRDHTCRRITGSRPSTGSSSTRMSGRQHRASQKADCFCMPLESRRMGCFSGMVVNTSFRAS